MPTSSLTSGNHRKAVSQAWQKAYAKAREAFGSHAPRMSTLRSYSLAISAANDAAIAAAFAKVRDNVAVLAVGSYGRREVLLHSDVDLLILTHETPPKELEKIIAACWTAGVRIGHSVHTPKSACAAMDEDISVLTNFLRPRFICGDKTLLHRFRRAQRAWIHSKGTRQLVDSLFAHRELRHKRFGDSRFMLEPHLKDGKGALRDAQMLSWVAQLAFGVSDLMRPKLHIGWTSAAATHYRHAMVFLLTLRANLHHVAGRAEERLSFDAQLSIAQRLGYKGASPEQKAQGLMADYFKALAMIAECTRTLCTLLDRAHARTPPFSMADQPDLLHGLSWRDGRIYLEAPAPDFGLVLPMFAMAAKYQRDIHPETICWIQDHRDALIHYFQHQGEACVPLRDILLGQKPAVVLKRLHDSGVLSMVIPEFDHVYGQMQYDGYHTYTVDAHILLVVENIHALERAEFAIDAPVTTQAARDLINRRALYVAALCHDLAKGTGGHHQEKGAAIARRVAGLLGLQKSECELAAWLVTHHQHISDTAFKRDIDDPQTIDELVALVQSPERLRLLLVLTVADMRAVAPNIWNAWKLSVIRKLYERTMRAMGVMLSGAMAERNNISHAMSAAEFSALSDHEVVVEYAVHTAQAATEITILMHYEKDALWVCAGVLAAVGCNIVAARTIMVDERVCRLLFTVQNQREEAFDDVAMLRSIQPMILSMRRDPQALQKAVKSRRFLRPSAMHLSYGVEIFFDFKSSASATIVEVNAIDRSGLLYDILGVFEKEQLHVASAYVATYGQKVVDVFYVKNRFGLPLNSPQAAQHLRKNLQSLLSSL